MIIIVFTKPINVAWEIALDKVEAFWKNKNMAQKAIERSEKHYSNFLEKINMTTNN